MIFLETFTALARPMNSRFELSDARCAIARRKESGLKTRPVDILPGDSAWRFLRGGA